MSETIKRGELALVEVLGLPGQNQSVPAAFVYRLHTEVKVGGMVLVPAPEWTVRVTGREALPGFVLGVPGPDSLKGLTPARIKSTIPSPSLATDVDPAGSMRAMITTWKAQASALITAANHITEAANAVEKALGN